MQKKADLPLALPADTVLAGKYVIRQALGQGGFGITYMAEDYKTKEKVAVKEFFPDTMVTRGTGNAIMIHPGPSEENFVYGKDCFLEEAKTLAEFIGNENIIRVICYFEENCTAYFVMEYIEGESFQDYIKSHGGKVSWEDAAKYLFPVMDALDVVHSRGIIHRDVTPDNIYITKEGVVKLLDFGAARYSLGDKSRSLDVVLKHGFAPKEQYTRRGRQGPFTDVYIMGASFYYALTGKLPPESIERMEEDDLIPPTSLGAAISPDAEDAILKALNIQPAERFQDMAAFKHALTCEKESVYAGDAAQEFEKSSAAGQAAKQNHPEERRQPGNKLHILIGCGAGMIIGLLGMILVLFTDYKKNANLQTTVPDGWDDNVYDSGRTAESNDPVAADGNSLALDAAEESSDGNMKTMEESAVEETEPEETAEDDPYSLESLGYDYEKEMEWDNHRYYVFDASRMTWEEALEDAESYGGYLARINSKKEMKHIIDLLEDYEDIYRYIYVGGARDSNSSNQKVKKSYCWMDSDLGFMKKQYISGPKASDSYKWLDQYWLDGEPSFKDSEGEEQVLEFIQVKGTWWLNDVSSKFPFLSNVSEDTQYKIGYLIEYDE